MPHTRPLHGNRRMPPSVSIYPSTLHILYYYVCIYMYSNAYAYTYIERERARERERCPTRALSTPTSACPPRYATAPSVSKKGLYVCLFIYTYIHLHKYIVLEPHRRRRASPRASSACQPPHAPLGIYISIYPPYANLLCMCIHIYRCIYMYKHIERESERESHRRRRAAPRAPSSCQPPHAPLGIYMSIYYPNANLLYVYI